MRLAAAVVVLAGLAAAPAAQALELRPCPGQDGFGCGTLRVPLDPTGAEPGTIGLRVAVQDAGGPRRADRVVVALTGGPGQSGVGAASSFRETLRPLLRTRRLVTLDQRGTGGSGVLDCPPLQRLSALAPYEPGTVAACAETIGPRRRFFSTRQTVADLEALRRALRAPKLGLAGISYGTHVAQQYARIHPDRTERLLLDSPVAPRGVEPFLRDTLGRIARVLDEQCRGARCRRVTTDPVADLATVVRGLAAGSLTGRITGASGRRATARIRDGEELLFLLIAGDVNPSLQALLPAALRAAAAGDPVPLLRLRRIADGTRTPRGELSLGLNAITSCLDTVLPYDVEGPVEGRVAALDAAVAAIAPATLGPFDRRTARGAGAAEDCSAFPPTPASPAVTSRLPDVPVLLLSGGLDVRTPLENARAVAASGGRPQRVTVPGTGHDTLDADLTGCVATAVRRWAAGRRVGSPCAGRTNADPIALPPPARLSAVRPVPGVAGERGRVLAVAVDALSDAGRIVDALAYAGLPLRAGGLRGGRLRGRDGGSLVDLRGYELLRGVRVTGSVRFVRGGPSGRLSVDGPGATDGALDLGGGAVRGRLGGRAVAAAIREAGGVTRPFP